MRRVKGGATVIRGLLRLSLSPFTIRTSLFDMTGREVMPLRPGANNVSRLAPGVYFVHSTIANRQSQMARVVLTE